MIGFLVRGRVRIKIRGSVSIGDSFIALAFIIGVIVALANVRSFVDVSL